VTALILPRRKFLTGLMGLVAAPAVVKAASLMPVKVIEPNISWHYDGVTAVCKITNVSDPYAAALIESIERMKAEMTANMAKNLFTGVS
jgi:hypothetical protein